MNCDVMERDSPALSQTFRGQWDKRERLGTRLCNFLHQFPGANSPFHSQTKTFVSGFTSDHGQCLCRRNVTTHLCNHAFPDKNLAVPLNGTGSETWGRGRWDACTGTWDSGARDKGLRDVKYGVR